MVRQYLLPGFDPGPPEQTYMRLARTWRAEITALEPGSVLPRRADEIALAALLLAFEHGSGFTSSAWREAVENSDCCARVPSPWMDQMPWRLASVQYSEMGAQAAVRELVCNLDHRNSNARVWMMEVAWMMRSSLPRDEACARLLENVASTLMGVDMSWGLAGDLFDTEEEFLLRADSFKPTDFASQYSERLAVLRGQPLLQTQAQYWWLESRCRRLIAETAMNLEQTE
jgi:hypothetical protein